MSAAPTHLGMLNRAFASARFLVPVDVNIEHRRNVAALCVLFKIMNRPEHPLHSRLPGPAVQARRTRRALQMNTQARISALSRSSSQFNRSFFPCVIEIWNFLPQGLVDSQTMDSFKHNVNKHLLT